VNLFGIEYDRQKFDQAGLPYPAAGWTWDEFFRDLKALSGGRMAYLDAQEFYTSILAARLDKAVANGNSADAIAAQYLAAVHDQSLSSFNEKQTIGERQALLADHQPAMWAIPLGTTFSISPEQGGAEQLSPHHAIVPYPVDAETDRSTPAGLSCLAISKGASHPKAIWKWLTYLSRNWLVTVDAGNRLQEIPARISTADQSGYWKELPTDVEPSVRYGLAHAWYGPADARVFHALHQAIDLSLKGQTDFNSAFSSARQALLAQPSPTPDSRTVQVAAPLPLQSEAGEGKIKFFTDTIHVDVIQDLVSKFERDHPQIGVDLVTDLADYAFQNNDLSNFTANFDCFTGPNLYASQSQAAGAEDLYPIDDLLAGDPSLQADFFPGQLDLYRANGVMVALPAVRDLPTLSYNADLLKQTGLDVPDNAWTFDDFLAYLNQVASSSGAGKPLYGYAAAGDSLLRAGHNLQITVGSGASTLRLDRPDLIAGATWLAGLAQAHAILPGNPNDPDQLVQLVAGGQVVFWDTSLNGWFFNGGQPSFKTGQVPLPATSNPVGSSTGSGYFISRRALNPQACWDLITYLSIQPASAPYWPVRKSVADSTEWQALVGAQNSSLYKVAKGRPAGAGAVSYREAALVGFWTEAMRKVYSGQPAQMALLEAQARMDRYTGCLESAGYPDPAREAPKPVNDQCLNTVSQ
jgi:ABC-type glycerol-3-phosphate transport system substrate-binding protein